mmetsp:Transcript_15123/g.26350  ORF Transcript_15123/g.26350 Transcript_15123/m.26350 type:complete len:272 (+) Transcript_15123:772-1587(+)
MAHLILLGSQIRNVFRICAHLYAHTLRNLQSVPSQTAIFGRVIGHQLHLVHSQVGQNLGSNTVLPTVNRQSKVLVSLNGVAPLVLQSICSHLVSQSNASPFLTSQVNENSAFCFVNLLECKIELVSAITSQRPKDIPRATFRMYTDQNRLVLIMERTTLHQGQMLLAIQDRSVRICVKQAKFGGKTSCHLANSLNQLLCGSSIPHQIRNRCHHQVMFLAKLLQIRHSGHGTVAVVDNFAQDAHGGTPCQTRKIDRSLGVTHSFEHTTFLVS